MVDPLNPSLSLLCKLGSALVRYAEWLESDEPLDLEAFNSICIDEEVLEWLETMKKLTLIPLKRN